MGGGWSCASCRSARVVDISVPPRVVELGVLELPVRGAVQAEPLELLLEVVGVRRYVGLLVDGGGAARVVLLVEVQPGPAGGGEGHRGQGGVGVRGLLACGTWDLWWLGGMLEGFDPSVQVVHCCRRLLFHR